ncbi:MAG: CHAT domain-containing protein, partial [Bacteroidota bacterium]|nr:CHAT domain-containing protein [Bacteroidota bacterium]
MRGLLLCCLGFLLFGITASGQDARDIPDNIDELILTSRFEEAMELLEDFSRERPSMLAEIKKSEILTRQGKFADAQSALAAIQARLLRQPDHFLQGITDTNLGFLQLNRGRGDLAEESLQHGLRELESAGKIDSPETAATLSYLGLVYMSHGKYAQAQEHLHRALTIRQKAVTNRDAFLAANYNDLGLAYSQTDKDRALDFYEQARASYRDLYGEKDPRIAIVSINLGILYRDLELYGDAINHFEKALSIWNTVHKDANPAKAIALYNLGQTYLRLHDEKSAADLYDQSLRMYRQCYGNKHPEIASVLNAIGNLQLAHGQFDEALTSYQAALEANVIDLVEADPKVNPALENYYSGTRLLHTLLFKAEAFESRYTRKTLKFADLQAALDILTRCDSLIDQLRQHSANESDKLLLGVIATEVYSDGVRIAYLAGLNAIRKEQYFRQAFYFAEKSKGAVLLESISEANAKSYAGIPPNLLEEEKELKSALAVIAQKLAQKPAAEQERSLRDASFGLKRKYEGFIGQLEKEYPAYFNLKFNSTTPSLPEIQALLDDHTAVVSFFIDDKHEQLYIFLLRNHQYRVWQRALPANFDKYITGLRNGLYFQEISTYKTSAYILGRALLPPIPASVRDLVILPAGRLGLVPFETLLTADPGKATDYGELPYLLNAYSIRYEFSAGLLLQKSSEPPVKTAPSIFLCAPVAFSGRPYLGELPGTEKEVAEIAQLFAARNLSATAYTHEQADEELIKTKRLTDFRFVHFATHGMVDEGSPELSRIFLQSGLRDDGNLFAGEIYNLELNASLVTLSACQTGLGKLVRGEGVIGLSRALVYAGAKNILVSYWNVADESTAMLMKDFYTNLL